MIPSYTFKMFAPRLTASRRPDGTLWLEGIASSTIKDHHGDQITVKALRKMEASAIGMTIFMNHEYRVPQDVFGSVQEAKAIKTDAVDSETGERIWDLRLGIAVASTNEEAVKAHRLIADDKVQLGLSIGAMVPDGASVFDKKTNRYVIDDIDLVETSVVGIPANPRSFVDYAVKGLLGLLPIGEKEDPEKAATFVAKRLSLVEQYAADETAVVELPDEPEEPDEPEHQIEASEEPDVTKAKKPAGHQHPHAHVHEHEHEHGYADSLVKHSHEHAHTHSHEHTDDHDHQDTQDDWQHNHGHSGSWEEEHAHAGLEKDLTPDMALTAAVDPLDLTKARVTVWEDSDGAVIEVSTRRSKPADDGGQSAQGDPDTAGGTTKSEDGDSVSTSDEHPEVPEPTQVAALTAALGDAAGITVKAALAQLTTARQAITTLTGERDEARTQRDEALALVDKTLEHVRSIVKKVGELPMGRKTIAAAAVTDDLADLEAIYAEDVRKLMTK